MASVGAGVASGVEAPGRALILRLLGPLAVTRDGIARDLPPSKKVRALLCYLALATRPVARSRLCELLWQTPDDPRGELRWCLTKLRALLDTPQRRRVQTKNDNVSLDLADCFVDALEVLRASGTALEAHAADALLHCMSGELLEGLDLSDSVEFSSGLKGQRRRVRAAHVALIESLIAGADEDRALEYTEQWLSIAPFDMRAHRLLLDGLARRNRVQEGDAHVAMSVKHFEEEGLDAGALRGAWQDARSGTAEHQRASVAIMPLVELAKASGIGKALTHDVITRLAKLRSLFVIAQGTVFALHERGIGLREAARMLGVDYIAGGFIERRDSGFLITLELSETQSGRILWTETFSARAHETLEILQDIGDSIVASIAGEIEMSERNRAILRPPSSLNAWSAHHRGLWHMYRFNSVDNDQARQFFQMALKLDPTFARAYAGLSFTHFQNAFLGWGERACEIDRAFESAGKSIMADDRDPAAHWAMGRALWLRGDCGRCEIELEQAIDLSPNFALAHYTLGFVRCQSGDPDAAIASLDYSRRLSPFDPLLFAIYASRASALLRLGRFEEAAEFASKAAARPNAHANILSIAAYCAALIGKTDDARVYLSSARMLKPGYDFEDFSESYHFEGAALGLFKRASELIPD